MPLAGRQGAAFSNGLSSDKAGAWSPMSLTPAPLSANFPRRLLEGLGRQDEGVSRNGENQAGRASQTGGLQGAQGASSVTGWEVQAQTCAAAEETDQLRSGSPRPGKGSLGDKNEADCLAGEVSHAECEGGGGGETTQVQMK